MELIKEFFNYLEINELSYVVLIVMLFILPRILNRIGIPIGLGAFLLGYLSANVFAPFAILGISSLFLYAGLELDFDELKENTKLLVEHLIIRGLTIGLIVILILAFTTLDIRIAALISLALLTPSTGFILDSLPSSNLTQEQKLWVKNKAIASEILALLLLLLFQSQTPVKIALSAGTLILLILILPVLFHWVSKRVSIKTPGADFSFLLLLAVATGTITKKLGAYYLVGAFLVGFTVNFYEKNIIKKPKEEFERTAKFFASFFLPFYFFNAGLKLHSSTFSYEALWIGLLLTLLIMPIRVGLLVIHRKISMKEAVSQSLPISISLLPTLVFGLVVIDILKGSGLVKNQVLGGLVIYTILITILPSLLLQFFTSRKDLAKVANAEPYIDNNFPVNHPKNNF